MTFLLISGVLTYVAAMMTLAYAIHDLRNWTTIAEKGGYVYQQHKTRRKRRVFQRSPQPNMAWVRFETEEP